MKKISITNKNDFEMELIVEPAAESYKLLPGQIARMETIHPDTFEIEVDRKYIVVYEEFGPRLDFGLTLVVFIDDKIVYPR